LVAGLGLGVLAMVATGPVTPSWWEKPSGLVMAAVELSQGQVQEMQDRIRAAGGWCAPSEVIYMKDPSPETSPTGFIPEMADVMALGEERHEIFARWDEEDAWLREQLKLAAQSAPPEWVELSGLIL
jgi:hypothetical protein